MKFRRVALAVPAVLVMAALGGLVGLIFDHFWLGFAIGALIPVAWLSLLFFMLSVGLGLVRRFLDSTRSSR
jgi:hypothetical protein